MKVSYVFRKQWFICLLKSIFFTLCAPLVISHDFLSSPYLPPWSCEMIYRLCGSVNLSVPRQTIQISCPFSRNATWLHACFLAI
ncbi:uncharacterized protein EV420DRAFT_805236 [Desarmillaria tabescens]|uniref:Uncharacterized protein n=1 Tax=Armillaria tabescens TaxID=1929756 RepID=A0AA39NI08_ARMTA|nr:uncharacterized protein EV420DRAFT_805236 [Desarmillaria tabescens]KAK0465992.1 hypothetical protein EV420DRAFT_805236 [Desarmillaria tabescens]